MLSVTNSALKHLHDAMNQAPDSESCFRMIAKEDNTVGLIREKPAAGDKTFDYDGAVVLALPENLAEPLSERTLDVDEGKQLVLLPKPS